MKKHQANDNCFDFEAGYLLKSPCRMCEEYDGFPACAKTCDTLARIQKQLARTITCTKTNNPSDEYAKSVPSSTT